MTPDTVLTAIEKTLRYRASQGVAPDLLARWTRGMETQVNVAAGDGQRVEGRHNVYVDGTREWWNVYVPKNAKDEPHFHGYTLDWPLEEHAVAIGCTAWDWENRVSHWVGFEFDSIVGHAAGVGVDDDQLEEVRRKAAEIPGGGMAHQVERAGDQSRRTLRISKRGSRSWYRRHCERSVASKRAIRGPYSDASNPRDRSPGAQIFSRIWGGVVSRAYNSPFASLGAVAGRERCFSWGSSLTGLGRGFRGSVTSDA